jgi:hypothetical protein
VEWDEIVLRGTDDTARAFVAGFLAGRGDAEGSVIFGADVDIEPGSLGQRVCDLLLAGSHKVLLAPEPLAAGLADELVEHGADHGLHLEGCRRIGAASFTVRAETFSRPAATNIRDSLLGSLPEGVRIEDREETEEKHPEAHGADLYAPVHKYTYRASGRIVGPLPGVLEMQRRAKELDFVETGRLHLFGVDE